MCGILGTYGNFSKNKFINSINLQSHRGPDGSGFIQYDKFKLGHRRLSIIDISEKSSQPMISSNDRFIIIYNGEIYNFQEIRQELIKQGIKFKSKGDTEVLLNSYMYYGERCLKKLRGMFAFCIFDKKQKTFFIARDRLGIKPLYFYHKKNSFIFSSEIKSILNLINKYSLNINAVSSYLSFRYPIGEQTFFNEISELKPGNYLKFHKNKIQIKEYWSLKNIFINKKKLSLRVSKKEIKEELNKSIKYRTISDVPVGTFMSGGLDSSLLTALISKQKLITGKLQTYTIAIKNDPNEFKYARLMKKKYKLNHEEILINRGKYLSLIDRLVKYKDAPLGIPNEVLLYSMSKKMKKNITVVLSGEGADEIFGGYGRIYGIDEDFIKLRKKKISNKLKKKLKEKYNDNKFRSEFEHFLHVYKYFSLSLKEKIFKENINIKKIENNLTNKLKKNFPISEKINYFDAITYFFLKVHVRGLLQRIDSMTMATSIEARVPFLDHELIKTAINIPKNLKLRKLKNQNYENLISDEISEKKNITKFILKDTFKTLLPKEILDREKIGFPVFLQNLFNNNRNIRNLKKKFLKSEILKLLFKRDKILKILCDKNKSHKDSFLMWMILNLDSFYKQYFVNK